MSASTNPDSFKFTPRFSFYSYRLDDRNGNKFDIAKIIQDIKKALARYPVKIIEHSVKPIYDGGSVPIRYKVSIDLQISIASNEIRSFENNNKSKFNAFENKDSPEGFFKKYVSILNRLLENIEGIDYVPQSCNPYEMIYYEGQETHGSNV